MNSRPRGIWCGLLAAALFGLSAPLAKLLLPVCGPVVLAGLLYAGAGLGLSALTLLRRGGSREAPLRRGDLPMLAAITLLGGALGPVLMLTGLARVSGVSGSLLLNLEAPLTILVAALIFREHLGRRMAAAAVLIVGGGALLAHRPGELQGNWTGVGLLAGACLCWAIDNNLTQQLSLRDPLALVRAKALAAAAGNLVLAAGLGHPFPEFHLLLPALVLGFASYGLSVLLDAYALRSLGAAREAALFATAPFLGALAAVPLLGERFGGVELAAAAAMAAGVALLLTEEHSHRHSHEALEHEHLHVHDEHHRHATGHLDLPPGEPHSHPHRHRVLTHDHPHVPDLMHRHDHGQKP